MSIFEKIFRGLNKARVKYLVVGGVAVNLHGYVRFTGDLDLLILLDEANVKKIDALMKKLQYSPRLPILVKDLSNNGKVKKWLKEKNMRAFTFMPPLNNPLEIDVIIEESLKFNDFEKHRVFKSIGGVRIPVASIDDLLKMKKKAGRASDFQDIQALLEIKGL